MSRERQHTNRVGLYHRAKIQHPDDSRPALPLRLAGAAAYVMAVLGATHVAGGWSLPIGVFWAFEFIGQLPWSTRLTMAGAVAVSFLWVKLRPTPQAVASEGPLPLRTALVGGIAVSALFWILREHRHSGDAVGKLQLLSQRTLATDPFVWKEPLDSLVTYHLVGWLRRWEQSPEIAVALLSVAAGVLYFSSVLRLASLLAPTREQHLATVVALLGLGSSQLWFGHIENYSLVTAVAVTSMTQAVGFLRSVSPLWSVGLTAGLALSFHPQAAFLAPALLTLLDRRRWASRLGVLTVSGLLAPAGTVVLMRLLQVPWPDMTRGYAGDTRLFLEPAEVFHRAHLLDVLNNLLLASPLAVLWIGIGVRRFVRRLSPRDPVLDYLTAASVGILIYALWFQNDLPRQRDWDLFAIVGPVITIWGIHAWNGSAGDVASRGAATMTQRLWPALTWASAVTIAWVLFNHTAPAP